MAPTYSPPTPTGDERTLEEVVASATTWATADGIAEEEVDVAVRALVAFGVAAARLTPEGRVAATRAILLGDEVAALRVLRDAEAAL